MEGFSNLNRLIRERIQEHRNAGLSPEQIRGLERIECNEVTQCSVCLDNIQPGNQQITLGCDHTFHEMCLVRWAQRRNTCPMCRVPIVQTEEDTRDHTLGLNLTVNHVVTSPVDINVYFKFWDESEIETIFPPYARILDVFEFLGRLSLCYEYKHNLSIRFIGNERRQCIYKSNENIESLSKTLIECRLANIIIIFVDYC
jgi:hypothetical protein